MRAATFVVAIASLGAVAGVAFDRIVIAQQSGIARTVLQRVDDPAGKTHEAVMAAVDFPAGATVGRHLHHGVELGYVLEGAITVEHQGRAAATKKAGEFFQIDAGAPHDARNAGPQAAKILAIYLVEKGKPLAEPIK